MKVDACTYPITDNRGTRIHRKGFIQYCEWDWKNRYFSGCCIQNYSRPQQNVYCVYCRWIAACKNWRRVSFYIATGKHVSEMYSSLHSTFLFRKKGFTGINIFLICGSKHRLWVHVLVRTASICVLNKLRKISTFFNLFFFLQLLQLK